MTPDDVAALLTLKRAREQRAAAALAKARHAERQAISAQRHAEEAVTTQAAQRREQERAIYAHLLFGPLPSRRVQSAAARLSGIAAYSAALQRRSVQATRDTQRATEGARAAQEVHAGKLRGAETTELLWARLRDDHIAAEERYLEAELEEVAELRRHPETSA